MPVEVDHTAIRSKPSDYQTVTVRRVTRYRRRPIIVSVAYPLANESGRLVVELHRAISELDPARWRRERVDRARDELRRIQARLEKLTGRPWPEPDSRLRAELESMRATLAAQLPHEDMTGASARSRWMAFRKSLVPRYEELQASLREYEIHVPSLRPDQLRALDLPCARRGPHRRDPLGGARAVVGHRHRRSPRARRLDDGARTSRSAARQRRDDESVRTRRPSARGAARQLGDLVRHRARAALAHPGTVGLRGRDRRVGCGRSDRRSGRAPIRPRSARARSDARGLARVHRRGHRGRRALCLPVRAELELAGHLWHRRRGARSRARSPSWSASGSTTT